VNIGELLLYIFGAGGLLVTAVAAVWKERFTKRDYQREQDKHAEETKAFLAEIQRLNEERHKLAERRGSDTAHALDRATDALESLDRVVRDNTTALTRLERERERHKS
jgi:hypothetical protein